MFLPWLYFYTEKTHKYIGLRFVTNLVHFCKFLIKRISKSDVGKLEWTITSFRFAVYISIYKKNIYIYAYIYAEIENINSEKLTSVMLIPSSLNSHIIK